MRRLLAVLFVCGCAGVALALDQGGSIEGWIDAYPEGRPDVQGWFRGTYVLDAEPAPWVFARVALHLEADSHHEISRDTLYDDDDRDRRRAAMRFRDLALGLRAKGLTLVVGRQRLTWARTSFVNAADNLTPRDWTDPLDEQRLSPWAADLTWDRERVSIEAALVPRYAPSRLPQLGSRWLFPGGTGPPLVAPAFPAVTWENLQAGVRAAYRGSRGEARVTWFDGYDDAVHLTPLLTATFAKLRVGAIDGEVLAGAWSFRGEAGYFHFPEGRDDGYGLYQVEAQWSGGPWRVIAGYGDTVGGEPQTGIPIALDQAYLPAAFLSVHYGETTEWQAGLDATVGTDEGDSLVRVSGSYPFAGHVRAGGEIDLISGRAGSFWGRWRDNDRARAFLRFDF